MIQNVINPGILIPYIQCQPKNANVIVPNNVLVYLEYLTSLVGHYAFKVNEIVYSGVVEIPTSVKANCQLNSVDHSQGIDHWMRLTRSII